MIVDEQYVYISHENNRVTKWNCESGVLVKKLSVENPGNMRVKEDRIYVISEAYVKRMDEKLIEIKSGLNCVLILNKDSLEVLRKVKLENWMQPMALLFNNDQLLAAAYQIDRTNLIDKDNSLFMFDSNETFVKRLDIKNVESVLDMVLIENELFVLTYMDDYFGLIEFKFQ
jgi:hypothetical protein